MTRVALTVNGTPVAADVVPRTHLADFLREHLLLTGTHLGCEHGICGACTVEIDGEIARSCITLAVACDGTAVRTIEGFDSDALMARLRRAFTEAHALQCGYCTPGMLIAARDLVRRKGQLPRSDIRIAMSGNLCRCTGYQGIIDAIETVMGDTVAPATEPAGSMPGNAHARSWLGPAPGPVSPSGDSAAPPHADIARAVAPPQSITGASRSRSMAPPIAVSVGPPQASNGTVRLVQSFVLPHPRAAVWRLMADVEAVARCMPGLALEGPVAGDRLNARLDAAIGPIRASFAGEGRIQSFPAEHRQLIEGAGGDRRSGSRASGSVDYQLTALAGEGGQGGEQATRVDVIIAYSLVGPLAQLGRSGLVRDLVRRIGEAFAQNLDARLRDPAADLAPARLGGLSLLVQVLAQRLRDLFARLTGRAQP